MLEGLITITTAWTMLGGGQSTETLYFFFVAATNP